jgi:hypothetical protein
LTIQIIAFHPCADEAESVTMPPSRSALKLWLARVGVAFAIALALGLILIAPDYWRLLPRTTRRPIIETVLQLLLIGYLAAWAGSFAAIGVGLVRRREAARRARGVSAAQLLLGGCSLLLALVGAEITLGVWTARQGGHERAMIPVPRESHAQAGGVGPVRIVVVGESSARGYPYQPRLSVGQIVAWSLQNALPERKVEM